MALCDFILRVRAPLLVALPLLQSGRAIQVIDRSDDLEIALTIVYSVQLTLSWRVVAMVLMT